jgi:hypothetical protein
MASRAAASKTVRAWRRRKVAIIIQTRIEASRGSGWRFQRAFSKINPEFAALMRTSDEFGGSRDYTARALKSAMELAGSSRYRKITEQR